MSSFHRFTAIFTALVFLLSGCKPAPLYEMSKAEIAHTKGQIDQSEAQQYPPPAPVVTQSGAYVDTKKISLIRPPSWLKQRVVLHGSNLPVTFYISEILTDTDAIVYYDPSVDKKMLVSMDYSGTVEGALRKLSTLTNYHYTIDKETHRVNLTGLVSKTFDIKFIPGSASYTVGGQVGAASGGSSSGGDSGGTSMGITDSQNSQFTGSPSLWTDLLTAVKGLMSKDGNVTVSQSTTTVTVRDRPENVVSIEKYINKLNRELTKQVRLQVQILEVRLTKEYAFGIDWGLVATYMNPTRTISLTSDNFQNIIIPAIGILAPTQLSLAQTTGKYAGSTTVIQALQQQGDVSVVTQPSVVTLNNQIAQVSIQTQQNYLSSVSSTTSDFSVQSTAETGSIITGLALYLLPKIQSDKVFLQLSSTLADLEQLQTFNLNTGAITDTTNGSNSGGTATPGVTGPNFVQLPKVDERIINQRAMIHSGDTLVLTGYKRLTAQTAESKFYNSDPLGGQSAATVNAEIVLLITPTIIADEDEEYFEEVG